MDASHTEKARSSRWRWVIVAILVLPAAWALYAVMGSMFADPSIGPIRGLRLGYPPAAARERFTPDGAGTFRSEAMDEDFALVWTADSAHASLREARLEFHLGQLVAARLQVEASAPEAAGPPLEVSDTSILAREPSGARVNVTWLARSCPTHADEVSRRIRQQR